MEEQSLKRRTGMQLKGDLAWTISLGNQPWRPGKALGMQEIEEKGAQ